MSTVNELSQKIVTLIGLLLDAQLKDRRLEPVANAYLNCQTAIYWLRLCIVKEDQGVEGIAEQEFDIEDLTVPTLLGVRDYLDYITKELKTIILDLEDMIKHYELSSSKMTYYLQRVFDRIHESVFYVELATNYHGQLTRQH